MSKASYVLAEHLIKKIKSLKRSSRQKPLPLEWGWKLGAKKVFGTGKMKSNEFWGNFRQKQGDEDDF